MEPTVVEGFDRQQINLNIPFVIGIVVTIITVIVGIFEIPFLGYTVALIVSEFKATSFYFPLLVSLSVMNGIFYGVVIYYLQLSGIVKDIAMLRNSPMEMDYLFIFFLVMMLFIIEMMYWAIFLMAGLIIILLGLGLLFIGIISYGVAWVSILIFESLIFPLPDPESGRIYLAVIFIILYILYSWNKRRNEKVRQGVYQDKPIITFGGPNSMIKDEDFLICSSKRKILVYSISTKELLYKLTGHWGVITDLDMGDNNMLYSFASIDRGELGIWKYRTEWSFEASYKELSNILEKSQGKMISENDRQIYEEEYSRAISNNKTPEEAEMLAKERVDQYNQVGSYSTRPQNILVNESYVVIITNNQYQIFDHQLNPIKEIYVSKYDIKNNSVLQNNFIMYLNVNSNGSSEILIWNITNKLSEITDTVELDKSYGKIRKLGEFILCIDSNSISVFSFYPELNEIKTIEIDNGQDIVKSNDPFVCLQRPLKNEESKSDRFYEIEFYNLKETNPRLGKITFDNKVKTVIGTKSEFYVLCESSRWIFWQEGEVYKINRDKLETQIPMSKDK